MISSKVFSHSGAFVDFGYIFSRSSWSTTKLGFVASAMTGAPNKRQKREDYKKAQESLKGGGDDSRSGNIELPKKKFYRQRAHANPFSDHALT